MSVVVVTHELESAFKIADRIVVLDRGYIIFSGTVAEIKASTNQRIQNLITALRRKKNSIPRRIFGVWLARHRLRGVRSCGGTG